MRIGKCTDLSGPGCCVSAYPGGWGTQAVERKGRGAVLGVRGRGERERGGRSLGRPPLSLSHRSLEVRARENFGCICHSQRISERCNESTAAGRKAGSHTTGYVRSRTNE